MSPKPTAKTTMNLRTRKKKASAKKPTRPVDTKNDKENVSVCVGNTCQLCPQPQCFPSIQECAAHIVDVHVESLALCPHCARAFPDEGSLAAHAARHERRRAAVSCAHCRLYYATPALLERHDYERHEAELPGMVLRRHLPLLSAQLRMNFANFVKCSRLGRPLCCALCDHVGADAAAGLAHARRACRPPLVCDKCASVFRTKATLHGHLLKSSKCRMSNYAPSLLPPRAPGANRLRTICCKRCKKRFPDRASYHSHWDTCSTSRCAKCDEEFDSLLAYNAHCAERHRQSLRTLNCTYCRMEFISEKTLLRHVKKHERYACLRCGKKFRTPKPLLLHIKNSHADVEPYRCLLCTVNFKEGLDFKLHIKEHGGRGYINFDENLYVTYSEVATAPAGGSRDAATESEDVTEKANSSEADDIAKDPGNGGATPAADDVARNPEAEGPEAHTELTKESREAAEETGEEAKESEVDTKDSSTVKRVVKRRFPKVTDEEWQAAGTDTDSEVEKKRRRGRRGKAAKSKIRVRREGLFPEKTYRCSVCGRRTSNMDSFNKHVTMHFRQGAKQCGRCAKIFRSAALLARHVAQEHGPTAPGSALQRYLRERAARKLVALEAARRAAAGRFVPRTFAAPPPRPFRVRLRRVAASTWRPCGAAAELRADAGVTVTRHAGEPPAGAFGGLTVRRYVESFRPEREEEAGAEVAQTGPVKLITLNKSLKVRSVSSRGLRSRFTVSMRRYREPPAPPPGAPPPRPAPPKPYRRPREPPALVTVRALPAGDSRARTPLHYGERAASAEVCDGEYFETDDQNVAQIEVLSTATPTLAPASRKPTFVLQLTDAEPSTAEIERNLAEVCAELDAPTSALHVGQLTTRAPYYKIINVRKVRQRQERALTTKDLHRRFQEIKIGDGRMVSVNPLAHLLRRAKGNTPTKENMQTKAPAQNINIIPVESIEEVSI